MAAQVVGSVKGAVFTQDFASEVLPKQKKSGLSFEELMAGGGSLLSSGSSELKASETKTQASNNKVSASDSKNSAEAAAKKLSDGSRPEKVDNTNATDNNPTEAVTKEEKILKAADEIKSEVMKALNISEEEFNELLEVLGLNLLDILNPELLTQVVMTASGLETPQEFLFNETAADTLKGLLDTLNNVLSEEGITKEDLRALVKEEMPKILNPENDFKEILQNAKTAEKLDVKEELPKNEINSKTESSLETKTSDTQKDSFEVEVVNTAKNDKEASNSHSGGNFESLTEQFLNKLTQNIQTVQSADGQTAFADSLRDIAMQVIEQVKININPNNTFMEVQLNPESLGKVQLNITSKQGVMTAQLLTQNEVAKEAIESQIQVLRENLEKQGIKVEAIEVTVAQYSFDNNAQAERENENENKGSQRRRPLRMPEADTDMVNTVETANITVGSDLLSSGSSVDYSA